MENFNAEFFDGQRTKLWSEHPLITAGAVLPTHPIKHVMQLVKQRARRHRSSLALWANPLTGKSSCIRALREFTRITYPKRGFVVLEAVPKRVAAQGAFLDEIIAALGLEVRSRLSLSDKLDKVCRGLLARCIEGKHLFFVIDEAQELLSDELCWLKTILNYINNKQRIKVTVILFGQRELISIKEELASKRSDLNARYTSSLCEFQALTSDKNLEMPFGACDTKSEFPAGSGICYTHFVWPRAYGCGLRLVGEAHPAWSAFLRASPIGADGLSMEWVASTLSELADITQSLDADDFKLTEVHWNEAVRRSGYIERPPSPTNLDKEPEKGRSAG